MTDFIHRCEDQLQKLKKQKEKGLLYGIPVSIKDHINCKVHPQFLCLLPWVWEQARMSHPHQDWLKVPSDKDILDPILWDQQTCLSYDENFVFCRNFSPILIWFSLG